MLQKLGAVSYWYPGAKWDLLLAEGDIQDIYLINPNSGPGYGTSFDVGSSNHAAYSTYINKARSAGHMVIAYVTTNYHDKNGVQSDGIKRDPLNIANVFKEIDVYYTRFPGMIDGIFFDEMSPTGDAVDIDYYTKIFNYMQTKPGKHYVVQNPGGNFPEGMINVADTFMSFENTYSSYLTYTPPTWQAKYPANKFWHVAHTCPATEMKNAVALSRKRNAGRFYCTELVMPNPYSAPTTYLKGEAAELRALNALENPVVVPAPEPVPPVVTIEPVTTTMTVQMPITITVGVSPTPVSVEMVVPVTITITK
jgi:hypothetical protein